MNFLLRWALGTVLVFFFYAAIAGIGWVIYETILLLLPLLPAMSPWLTLAIAALSVAAVLMGLGFAIDTDENGDRK
jgi:hypothetical protein